MKTCFVGYLLNGLVLVLLPVLSTAGDNDDPYNGHGRADLDPSIGVIIVVLVCAFFVTGCIATYIGGCANASAPTAAPYGRYLLPIVSASQRRAKPGLDRSEIETFPTFVYSDVKKLKVDKRALECAVCLAEFGDEETLRLLPKCEHAFHPECIDPWLSVRSTCPVCRSDLIPIAAEIRAGGDKLTTPPRGSDWERGELDFSDDEEFINYPPDGEGRNGDVAAEMMAKPNPVAAKFVRSNSTGHSSDRFRLRLPEEVRRHILAEANMRRVKSFGTLPRAPSSRKGYRSGGEGSNSQSGRLVRWSGLVKSGDGDIVGASSDAILVAILVN